MEGEQEVQKGSVLFKNLKYVKGKAGRDPLLIHNLQRPHANCISFFSPLQPAWEQIDNNEGND